MIEDAIATYKRTHRAPMYADSLPMSDWYALFPGEAGCVETIHKWPAKFPNPDKPGIYLIFDAAMSLLYVGKMERDLHSRLTCYFGCNVPRKRRSGCLIRTRMLPPWKSRPYYVRTIPVKNREEAPVLESHLKQALQPPDNTRP